LKLIDQAYAFVLRLAVPLKGGLSIFTGAGTMSERQCPRCRLIRTVLLSVLLGGGAGFGVLAYGASSDVSMTATFVGAILPLLWLARQNRAGRKG